MWRRLVRFARLCEHVARGLLIAWLRYPRLSHAAREAEKKRWSLKLLSILSVSVRETNEIASLPERCMFVLNHISWLDIFVVDATFPATFVAKSEISRWPVAGWLCTLVGTIYIEQGKRAGARRAREQIANELARGTLVAICPEGTTTFGDSLGRFHAALFQPAIDAEATIQLLALRYVDDSGRHTRSAGYVGDTSFLQSLWTILSTPRMVAEMTAAGRFAARDQTRRTMAESSERAIARALGISVPPAHGTAPE
jgi:1-acyl-sn-glycerol-3-phosphate acyltransferase